MNNPFTFINELSDLFGTRVGSHVATKTTYVPTGNIVDRRWCGYSTPTLDRNGSRTFPAQDWDAMIDWMYTYAPNDLNALHLISR